MAPGSGTTTASYFFNILDYTGSATRLFADPEFDGDPALITEEEIDEEGRVTGEEMMSARRAGRMKARSSNRSRSSSDDDGARNRRKFYVDGGLFEIAAHLVYELDPDGKQLRVVKYTDYTADKVRTLYPNAAELREHWADPCRSADHREPWPNEASTSTSWPKPPTSPTPTPSTCSAMWLSTPRLRTRRERAERLRTGEEGLLREIRPRGQGHPRGTPGKIRRTRHGQFAIPEILKCRRFPNMATSSKLPASFGGAEQLREAVEELQTLLYAA